MPVDPGALLETEAAGDPITQFENWYRDAERDLRLPEAVALATVGPEMRPSVRMVLARAWDERGFVFFTDYRSRKGRDIEANPLAALVFYWEPVGRQVRVEGTVARVSGEESDRYFSTRPRGSQVAACASFQSRPIEDRRALDERYAEVASSLEGLRVPRPSSWGGYRLVPDTIEFWQQRNDRLHDRLRYSRAARGWSIDRLQP